MLKTLDEQIDLLGLGLYSPSEAARYARVNKQKFSRWVFGTTADKPVFEPQLGAQHRVVTFLDFAQSLAIYEIRLGAGIALQKIREAYRRAQHEYGIKYPLAVKNGIFVFGDLRKPELCELGIYVPGYNESQKEFVERTFQLTGKNKRNQLLSSIVRPFSVQLWFSKDGIANKYTAFRSGRFEIEMDPECRFGKPYLPETGYEAHTLAEAVTIEGTVERAARLYRVEEDAVRAAVDYYKHLSSDPKPKPPEPLAA